MTKWLVATQTPSRSSSATVSPEMKPQVSARRLVHWFVMLKDAFPGAVNVNLTETTRPSISPGRPPLPVQYSVAWGIGSVGCL